MIRGVLVLGTAIGLVITWSRQPLAFVGKAERTDEAIERMVIGTVLGDAALVALRRMAHEHASARRFPG